MTDSKDAFANPKADASPDDLAAPTTVGMRQGRLRGSISIGESLAWGAGLLITVLGLWWYVTRGETYDERIISGAKLPSPAETFGRFRQLVIESKLAFDVFASLRRVFGGFLMSAAVGVPLGVACGCFPRVRAYFTPALVFGRNIPMAAVIPLTILLFGIDEYQKMMFIFIASVAFVISDSAQAIQNVPQKYVDTAYTLGASRWQVIRKVLFPLALPNILNSMRLLIGLAFGYIMLAEVISPGGGAKGLGQVIYMLERRGQFPQIYLILIIIPIVAFTVDRFLYWCQVELIPYKYPQSAGALADVWRWGKRMFAKALHRQPMRPPTAHIATHAPVVEFHGVTKTYNPGAVDEYTAIRDVQFSVEDLPEHGELICILGPSGCGKSTILKLIAGLEPQYPATAGQVFVQGREVAGPGQDRGMVFQDYTSFDHRTVLENVAFGLECQGVRYEDRTKLALQWIERVGLDVESDAGKYPHELSGGMRQRVAIARSLILQPRIILMDEPFGALDPSTRESMQNLLVSLWREVHATVFFVTHSIEEAVYLGDRIYVLSSAPGTIFEELDVPPPDLPAEVMQREPEFQDLVFHIRDVISRMEAKAATG